MQPPPVQEMPASKREDADEGIRLWSWVQTQLDTAQYRPQAAAGIEVSPLANRSGVYFILKNPFAKTYYRLSERDHFLWERMDGSHTVKDLVVAFFMAYGTFAFARVAGLVAGLKANRFLVDQPVSVYQQTRQQLQRRQPGYWATTLWRGFLQKQFAIHGMDGFISAVYRRGGRLLFTKPAQALFVVVSVVGLFLYGRLFASGDYNLAGSGGGLALGLVWLLALNLVSIFLHELSHGLTVKHYGREVRRAGFMIYFGLPAFFVDTTDIWMEGRRARLAVTWAGPYSGLILAGGCALVMTLWPALPINPLLYKFAFLALLTVFVNLNPLLELDGYYLLMDWLEIPMLRRKSLEFLRSGLWTRLREAEGALRSESLRRLSRDERIFVVFGLLSALWTAYALWFGVTFWQSKLSGSLNSLFQRPGDTSALLLALAGALISLAFVIAIGTLPLALTRRGLRWMAQRGFFASLWRIAALLLLGVAGLVWLTRRADQSWLEPVTSATALTAAAWLFWRTSVAFASSRLGWSLRLLAAFALLTLVAALSGQIAQALPLPPAVGEIAGMAFQGGAFLALLSSGLIVLANTDLRWLAWWERLALTTGWLASYWLALATFRAHPGPAGAFTVASVLAPWLALVCLTPTMTSFWRTSLGPGWAVLGLALAAMTGAAMLGLPANTAWLLLAGAALLHRLAPGRLSVRGHQPDVEGSVDDRMLLRRAFDWTSSSVLDQFREIAGRREARNLADAFNGLAIAAGWPMQFRGQEMASQHPSDEPLVSAGQRFGAALVLLLDLAGAEIGDKLALRCLQRAYDSLAWEEREIGSQYIFRHVPDAAALSQALQDNRRDYSTLLRRMPIFSNMSGDEIAMLANRLTPRRVRAGYEIVRQGEPGSEFYVIASGSVDVIVQGDHGASETVNRLGRGDHFGELALLRDGVRSATCRAVTPAEILVLSRREFDRLVRKQLDLRHKLDETIRRSELLRRLPLFAELDGLQVQAIAARMHEQQWQAGERIVCQGAEGHMFYVIEAGRVQAFQEQDGAERVLRESGPGEYFGEIALLTHARRTASVRALEAARLLALNEGDFEQLVAQNLYASRALVLESSRRMLRSRQTATG